MNYKNSLLIVACCSRLLLGQSSHDAPLELYDGSVFVKFRSDTFIDRMLPGLNLTPNQLLQHTHSYAHRVLVYQPGRQTQTINISDLDGLHFKLTGKRRFFGLFPGPFAGYLTVTPDDSRADIAGLVSAHEAVARQAMANCDSFEPRERKLQCIASALQANGNSSSANLVWRVEAPLGFQWTLPPGDSDASVSARIGKTAKASSHAHARSIAEPIIYQLTPPNGRPPLIMERFYVVPQNGQRSGHGIRLRQKARVVVCENIYDSATKKAVPACEDRR
jgi:hypothetical protein